MARVALVGFVACSLPAVAAGAPRAAVLGPFNALGISVKEAHRVRRWVMSAAMGIPSIKLRRVKRFERALARRVGCEADVRCVGALAAKLRESAVIVGDVGHIGGANIVYLQLVVGKEIKARESAVLDPRKGLRAEIRGLLYRLLLPDRYTGSLRIHSNLADCWVYLDGRRVGRGKEVKVESVRVGRHALRVTHPAHRDFVRFVHIRFKRAAEVRALLVPIEVKSQKMDFLAGKPLTHGELPWYRRWYTVAAFGAVVFAAAAVAVAMIPQDVDRDLTATVIRSQ